MKMKWKTRTGQVMDRTGCPRLTAMSLLEKHNGSVQAAIHEFFLENGWDLTLPRIPAPHPCLASHLPPSKQQALCNDDTLFSGTANSWNDDLGFNLRDIIGAIQGGRKGPNLRRHARHMKVVKIWACYAGNVDSHAYSGLPALGFAIALCDSFRSDGPLVVKTLLSLGWSADVIPPAFYEPLHRDLPDAGPAEDELTMNPEDEPKAWRFPSFYHSLVLRLAAQGEQLSGAYKRLAQVHKASELLGIRYFLVGQALASRLLTERSFTYLAMPTTQPLILVFAGPSGHGKTELAQNLGWLLSLDLQPVDCTNLSHETDLFGPWPPYEGWREGSVVNNYLAGHNGKRCIVFMDEFEKTKDEVRRALLTPFQSGEYRNRRTFEVVNCTKTIWVLATNAFDQTIHEFCDNNRAALFGDHTSKDAEETRTKLGQAAAPLTGRITDFIPFLPFSPIEQAAVADKYLAKLGRELTKPIDTLEEPTRYRPVGNVDLQVKRGYSVCRALAEEGYVEELGARSIINTVTGEIRDPVVDMYLATKDETREGQPAEIFVVGVDADSGEVEVSRSAIEREWVDISKD
ncbi:P-loop containing nucleoside triphosphate hydrolase protein [Chaetomidium leptoderma]|uniref:P-loop containing nucleoside triphosphate hydrolase protein n=1 Tax=Chaetomidium leptoderma TaxID=669021 RepID=A0AAN6VQC2_9PEZI|nr:P-loop containing nucleoside triphosphate hydrolase protein [Chaetomidium leptoderma]